jgi:dephospho-CoA kinase
MKAKGHKPVIGLLGAAGAGKTSVAREFEKLGCGVVCADAINHQVQQRAEVIEEIVAIWGGRVLDKNESIDRKALGDIVFQNDFELKKLTDLVHPLIEIEEKALIERYEADPGISAIVLDIPLLLENGLESWCDKLVLVDCDEGKRLDRLLKNKGWDAKKVKKVEKLQISLDTKAEISDYTLKNNSSMYDLAQQIARLYTEILENF